LKRERAFLIAHPEYELSPPQLREFEGCVQRRSNGEPVAYITGSAWFYGREFLVDYRVLVPRPETEHLVDAALDHLRKYDRPLVLDVGTGSGAIGCTIAAELPNAVVYASDKDAAALEVARENAKRLGLAVEECPQMLSAPTLVIARSAALGATEPNDASLRFDAIIANLPYIPTAELPKAPDPASFEPKQALDGGSDGLREYRELLPILPSRLHPGAIVLLEAAPPTIRALERLARDAFPRKKVTTASDYAGLERYVAVL
jgi:release factor glutamine methyltransferase